MSSRWLKQFVGLIVVGAVCALKSKFNGVAPFARCFALIAATLVAISVASTTPAAAGASCWCDLTCTKPDGTSFIKQLTQDTNYSIPSSAKANACRSFCEATAGAQMPAWAAENNVCGKLTCQGKTHLGTGQGGWATTWRDVEPLITERICEDSQYSAKLLCGPGENAIAGLGTYWTTVNIHNPHPSTIEFRTKVALANDAADGRISGFDESSIGPDGSQRFSCANLRSRFSGPPSLMDGFFVLESHKPLDVVGVYTDNSAVQPAQHVAPIHIDRVAERKITPAKWCGTPNYSADLAKISWQVRDPSGSSFTAVPNPLAGWAQRTTWLTPPPVNGNNVTTGGLYRYSVDFCSCSSKGGSLTGDARADNDLDGNNGSQNLADLSDLVVSSVPTPIPLFPDPPVTNAARTNSFSTFNAAVPFGLTGTVPFSGAGTVTLEVLVWNDGNITGFSPSGVLALASGKLGKCTP
jgi:hypothetical protein